MKKYSRKKVGGGPAEESYMYIENLKGKFGSVSVDNIFPNQGTRGQIQWAIQTNYNKPKGLEYIWKEISKKNSLKDKYGLYFDEIKPVYGNFGLAIIWNKRTFGAFKAGCITNYTDEVGRAIMFMITKKTAPKSVEEYYLFINAQNSNSGQKAKDGYPISIDNIEKKCQAFLSKVSDSIVNFNIKQIIFTGDLNDKFGKMIKKGIQIDFNGKNFSIKYDIVSPPNDGKFSCCANWDSSGTRIKSLKQLDFKQKEVWNGEKQSQVLDEGLKGSMEKKEKRACAGAGFRFDFDLDLTIVDKYLFLGDYALVINSESNNNQIELKLFNKDTSQKSKCSDHELVYCNVDEKTIGSYNMSFASDLGSVPNKTIFSGGDPRQESEMGFLLPLFKSMRDDNNNYSRTYFVNAVENLINFMEKNDTGKIADAVGLQEVNIWRDYTSLVHDVFKAETFEIQDTANLKITNDNALVGCPYMPGSHIFDSEESNPDSEEFKPTRPISTIGGAGINKLFTSEFEWLYYANKDFRATIEHMLGENEARYVFSETVADTEVDLKKALQEFLNFNKSYTLESDKLFQSYPPKTLEKNWWQDVVVNGNQEKRQQIFNRLKEILKTDNFTDSGGGYRNNKQTIKNKMKPVKKILMRSLTSNKKKK